MKKDTDQRTVLHAFREFWLRFEQVPNATRGADRNVAATPHPVSHLRPLAQTADEEANLKVRDVS